MLMQMKTFSFLLLLGVVLNGALVHADPNGSSPSGERRYFVIEKQEAKDRDRWSFSTYLEQRDRMRLMDLWLALHTPTPYEFYLGANYQWGSYTGGSFYSGWNLSVAGYASIFGLELQRELSSLNPRNVGLLHVRIFGRHAQDTNITLQGGAKEETRSGTQLWNALAGVDFTAYINRFFGIEGLYRHYFTANSPVLGGDFSGNRYELMAFIDYKFLRFYGGYFYDSEIHPGSPDFVRQGGTFGAKFFF